MKNETSKAPLARFFVLAGFAAFVAPVLLTPTSALAVEHTVVQKGKAFSVEKLEVKVGESVVFANEDDTVHNVFSRSETKKFTFPVQKVGEKSSVTFDKAGTVEVRCAIHPKMKMVIDVKP